MVLFYLIVTTKQIYKTNIISNHEMAFIFSCKCGLICKGHKCFIGCFSKNKQLDYRIQAIVYKTF